MMTFEMIKGCVDFKKKLNGKFVVAGLDFAIEGLYTIVVVLVNISYAHLQPQEFVDIFIYLGGAHESVTQDVAPAYVGKFGGYFEGLAGFSGEKNTKFFGGYRADFVNAHAGFLLDVLDKPIESFHCMAFFFVR
jgi:hypothetical protein